MKEYFHEIMTLLGDDKSRLPKLLLVFLMVSILDLIGIGLIGPYVAIVIDPQTAQETAGQISEWIDLSSTESLITTMSFVLLAIFAAKAVTSIWVNYIITKFGFDQQVRLKSLLMHIYQSLPYKDYIRRNSSEYIYNIQTLVNNYANGVVLSGMKMLSDGIVALVILTMLAMKNPLAFMLLIGLLSVVMFGYDVLFRKNIRHIGKQANLASTNMIQGVNEGIEGLKELRILGYERYFFQRVHAGASKFGQYQVRSILISTAPRFLLEFIMVLFIVLLVLMTLLVQGNVKDLLPTLAMFGIAAIRLLPAANMISNNLMQFRYNRDSVSRLYQDITSLQTVAEQNESKNTTTIVEDFELFSIDNASLRYPDSKENSLSNIVLNIHAGESIGLIGSSGSGKTTLVDMILGLLEPQSGGMSFNGKPLKEAMKIWQNSIAYLPQQVFLIDNTLGRNVALGFEDEEINEDKIIEALDKARLTELVKQLPNGINTLLGEKGIRLSGGQRQRVALARAFYHERSVLVMDEATSALDNETEREIVDEIQRLKGQKTMIVIAHRLSTVKNCDRIYKLEKGRIVSFGTPQDMLNPHIDSTN
jgi:ATP-binding cassette, subfamily B, bacterial PglK